MHLLLHLLLGAHSCHALRVACTPMMGELASLSELHVADGTHVWFGASMSVFVLFQILREIEVLRTIPTRESFLHVMLFVVPLQREFGLKSLPALVDVANENLLRLLIAVLPVQGSTFCNSRLGLWLVIRELSLH